MNNPDEQKIIKAMQNAGDRLVQLGFAERYMINDLTGEGEITWTAHGSTFKREMQRVYDLIAKDKGQAGQIDFPAFVNFLIRFK